MDRTFINHPTNVRQSTVSKPRLFESFEKEMLYVISKEEMLGNIFGARQHFETWLATIPNCHAWTPYIHLSCSKWNGIGQGQYVRYELCDFDTIDCVMLVSFVVKCSPYNI